MQLSPFLRCLDCGVCVAIRLVRFGYNPSTGRIALRVAPISPFPLAREPTVTAWRGTTLGRDITNAISLIMPLRLRGGLRNTVPRILVQPSSPTLDLLAAVAARVPSSKSHIPFISAIFIFTKCCRQFIIYKKPCR